MSGRRGIVLVLVSSLLVLLVAVAMVLVRTGGAHRLSMRVRLERMRADLLARSGLAHAMARLSRAPEVPAAPTAANQRDDWTYRDADAGIPLERSHNPSYAAGEPYVDVTADGRYAPPPGSGDGFTPALHDRDRDGTHSGITGRLRGALQGWGDTYALRIESEEAKIYVNGGYLSALDGTALDPANGTPDHRDPNAGYNATLRRILNTLGAVKEDANNNGVLDAGEDWDGDAVLDPPPVGNATLGDLILQQRPVGGYTSLAQLAARTGITRDLSGYITCHAWVDRSVIRPQAVLTEWSDYPTIGPTALADIKVARGGAPPLEPAGRAPVNPNLAHRAVLQSLVQGLGGLYIDPGSIGNGTAYMHHSPAPWPMGFSAAVASGVANRIVQARRGAEDANRNGYMDPGEDADGDGFLDSPLRTWAQFDSFCDALAYRGVLPPSASVGPAMALLRYEVPADILRANFNPNSDLNKNNPDAVVARTVDKSDLLFHSTEFSLHTVSGIFSVASLGRVRGAAGEAMASARHEGVVRCFVPLRQTSQQEFVGGRAALAYTTPMAMTSLSPSFRTFGARQALGGAANIGLSLATYPEPYYALPARAAGFDGQIGLATTELPNNPMPGNLRFLHRFTNSWAADYSATGATALNPVAVTESGGLAINSRIQTDLTRSTYDTSLPNTYVPDGVHIQSRRIPMYASVGNLPARWGVVSYWVKPGIHSRMYRLDASVMQAARGTDGTLTQVMAIGAARGEDFSGMRYGILVENTSDMGEPDNQHERTWSKRHYHWFSSLNSWGPEESRHQHRWVLVTAFWDLDNPGAADGSDNSRLWLKGARAMPNEGLDTRYIVGWSGLPGTDLANANRRLVLGGAMMYDTFHSLDANQTLDEFVVHDYGTAEAAAKTSASGMTDLRYADGRYYKRNDGRFTSTDLLAQLPSGTGFPLHVSRLYWTELLPRAPVPSPEPAGPWLWEWDTTLHDARIGVELLGGAAVLHDTETLAALDYDAAARVGRPIAAGPLRYRLTFKPTPNWSPADARYLNDPVLETPLFDDVTVLVRPPRYPRLVAWTGD